MSNHEAISNQTKLRNHPNHCSLTQSIKDYIRSENVNITHLKNEEDTVDVALNYIYWSIAA